jgi:hypothetical protein
VNAVSFYYTAAFANPVGLFGWMYILEAVGNDLGSEAAEKLNKGLRLGNKGLRFVGGHGVADRTHTKAIEDQIGRHVKRGDMADVQYVAEVAADLYVRMFREVGGGA